MWYSLFLLSTIFGGSSSSRLFQNIREEKGLAYSVYSMASSFAEEGYFNIYAGVSHDKLEAAIQAIREELAGVSISDSGKSVSKKEEIPSQMLDFLSGLEDAF